MKRTIRYVLFLCLLPIMAMAAITAGVGKTDITPFIGTPSAGYTDRKGEGMEGIHDPLLAIALFLDNGDKKVVFCSVDHLGYTYDMVEEITKKVQSSPDLKGCEIYIGSSHTHSGGGAYLNIPAIGQSLAGTYNAETTQFYITRTVEAILQAYQNKAEAKVGIGYGMAGPISKYRGLWPKEATPLSDVAVIKVTHVNGEPLAVLFNYPVHPTLLKSQNRLFSADLVGYARDHIKDLLGKTIQPIYFNGAQGDILPVELKTDPFESCDALGKSLAETVKTIWDRVITSGDLNIATKKESYSFIPKATPFGLVLPVEVYKTEMNLIVLNRLHAFITIPGELSCFYYKELKEFGKTLGYAQVSIFGLTNDAHGYIILPESWQHKTMESGLSFGGENYGELTDNRAKMLLKACKP